MFIRNIKSFAAQLSIYIMGVTVVLFILSFYIYFGYSSNVLLKEVLATQNSQVYNLTDNIDKILANIELSVESSLYNVYERLEEDGSLDDILHNTISTNNAIYGAAIALEPNYHKDNEHYFMIYAKRETDTIIKIERLGSARDYDYHAMDWYLIPRLKSDSYWSEPYFDDGGGAIYMATYSVPLYDKRSGEFIGVATADVSLDWITETIAEYKPYQRSYSYMLSRNAYYISHINSEKILRETFFTATYDMFNDSVTEIGYDMIAMKRGSRSFVRDGAVEHAFFAPIERVGWSVGIVSYESDIFMEINKVNRNFWTVAICGLILIFIFTVIVIRRATRPLEIFTASTRDISNGNFDAPLPQIKGRNEMHDLREAFMNMQSSLKSYIDELQESTKARERIESELTIAKQIQMGMLPTIFPPFLQLSEVDLHALLIPAKEVGGDLYDFFIDDNRFYFTVGDASGKGVPASLLMSLTSSLFRSMAKYLQDPEKILYSMNNSIAEKNDANMFITLFVGVLDVRTGLLTYSSAGHNAPVLLSGKEVSFIEVTPNLPLGIMPNISFKSHSTTLNVDDSLFVYSDGLTEAENVEKELYSDERLISKIKSLDAGNSAKESLCAIESSVYDFVKENEQSDDLTILVLKYINT